MTIDLDRLEKRFTEQRTYESAISHGMPSPGLIDCEAVLEMVAEIRRTAAEILDQQAKLARLYNAMCGAMALLGADGRSETEAADIDRIRVEMRAVFNASPGVLYQAGPGARQALERMEQLRRLAESPPTPTS